MIHTEDIEICHDDTANGGIAGRIYYAPADAFSRFEIPTFREFILSRIIAEDNIGLSGYSTLNYADVFLEQNSLSEQLSGSMRLWKNTSELSFVLLGMNAKNLAFMTAVRNTGLVFFVPDANGNIWIFGTPKHPAYCASGEAGTEKTYEADSTVSLSFSASTMLYKYGGVSIQGIKIIGGFSRGFRKSFRI